MRCWRVRDAALYDRLVRDAAPYDRCVKDAAPYDRCVKDAAPDDIGSRVPIKDVYSFRL